ncbi:MAG: SMP-30/gluconolactonase/LRE family protein, partial [Verrucomicrobiota bacterium]
MNWKMVLCCTLIGPAVFAQSLVEPGAEVKKLAGGMKFTEGPVWLPKKKKLVFSDIPNSKLMQWSERDGLSLFRESEQANGNILDLEGRIISCQHGARNVIRTEEDGSITVLASHFEDKRFNSPNDVAVRSDGTLWFTDPPWGLREPHEIPGHWVYKLDPATKKITVLTKELAMPNGIVFSPDEKRLYVADTGGNKRHPDRSYHRHPDTITCYDIDEDGSFGEIQYQIDEGSDGMAVDIKGNLYTTHGDSVNVFDPKGKLIERIKVPERPANCCFGGDDYKTLFITARN